MTNDQIEAVKGGGAAAIIISYFAGLTIPQWAALLACVYSAMLIGEKVVTWFLAWRSRRS